MIILNSTGLSSLSTWVLVLRTITNPIKAIKSIHRLGDVVQINLFRKQLLFIRKPEYIEEIFRQEAKGLLNRDALYDAKKLVFGDSLVNSRNDIWQRQRRVMQPLFNKDSVGIWSNSFIEESNALVDRLKTSGEINLSNELKQLIQRIFIRVLFGHSADKTPHTQPLIKAIDAISKGLAPLIVTELIGLGKLKLLFPFRIKRLHQALKYLKSFVQADIASKKNHGNAGQANNLIALLMQAKDPKTAYTIPEELLNDEAISLFFAGQDTTINTLQWLFYLTAKNPAVQSRMIEEIRQYHEDSLTTENLSKLVYTKAVLFETMRLYPSTAALSTNAVENFTLGEHEVTAGTDVILSLYDTHHHEKLWERPEEFYPEHFLSPLLEKRHKFAYFPFGGGAHSCIGRHFAELEMMVILVSLFRAFHFKTHIAHIKPANSITIKPDQDIKLAVFPH